MKYLIVTTTITQTQKVPFIPMNYGDVTLEDALQSERDMSIEDAIELLSDDEVDTEQLAHSVLVDVFDDGKPEVASGDDTGE